MKKMGKVLNVKGDQVFIVTKNNEFCIVQKNGVKPEKDCIYVGEEYKKPSIVKKLLTVLMFIIIIIGLVQAFRFFKAKNQFIIDMTSSFKITTNNLDLVTKIEGNNSKGREMLKDLDLKYKNIDSVLCILLKKSIDKKYIGDTDTKNITVFILDGDEKDILELKEFDTLHKNQSIPLTINKDGEGTIN